MIRTIAIDGPAGSGKTATGRRLAEVLGYWFLDTGIMYRAVTWLALERGISPDDGEGLERLAEGVMLKPVSPMGDAMEVKGRRVGPELKSAQVDDAVSNVSRHSGVRRAMVTQQRAYADAVLGAADDMPATGGGIVMVGRDIGTVVLPRADLKVFLTASTLERARRRQRELHAGGGDTQLEAVRLSLASRDAIDSSRDDSPLQPASDAWQLDSTELDLESVVQAMLQKVRGA